MSKRKSDASPAGIPHQDAKKRKQELFHTKGEFNDEVTLKFKDGKNPLFASAKFLRKPVFKSLFTKFIEKESNDVITISETKYDAILKFVEEGHPVRPIVHEPITVKNVHAMLPIAHAYQSTSMIKDCKDKLSEIIKEMYEKHGDELEKPGDELEKHGDEVDTREIFPVPDMAECLSVLLSASAFSFIDLQNEALELMAKFHSLEYNGRLGESTPCSEMFADLPDQIKNKLLLNRLRKCDKKRKREKTSVLSRRHTI